MSKPKAQGTAWETAFVQGAKDVGLAAARLPEGGSLDAGDVWIADTPYPSGDDIAVLAWRRLIDTGGSRRSPDGVTAVVVLAVEDFYKLALLAQQGGDYAFVAECKATERLNVTRELANAQRKLAHWKGR